jgi:hypothetical protein
VSGDGAAGSLRLLDVGGVLVLGLTSRSLSSAFLEMAGVPTAAFLYHCVCGRSGSYMPSDMLCDRSRSEPNADCPFELASRDAFCCAGPLGGGQTSESAAARDAERMYLEEQ